MIHAFVKKNDKIQTKPMPVESWFLPVSGTDQWSILKVNCKGFTSWSHMKEQ